MEAESLPVVPSFSLLTFLEIGKLNCQNMNLIPSIKQTVFHSLCSTSLYVLPIFITPQISMSCCAWNTIVFEWADKQKKQDSEKKPYPKHFEEANFFFFFLSNNEVPILSILNKFTKFFWLEHHPFGRKDNAYISHRTLVKLHWGKEFIFRKGTE